MPYLNHNIPPFSAYIRNEYLFNHTKGHGDFTFADVHTVNCMERRAKDKKYKTRKWNEKILFITGSKNIISRLNVSFGSTNLPICNS